MSLFAELNQLITIIERALPILKCNRQLAKLPYYYLDVTKHLTIYPNGHGIVMISNTIHINDRVKCREIYKKMDVTDGAKDFRFDTLTNMLATNKRDRFHTLGFWYEAEGDIVQTAEERYWGEGNYCGEDNNAKYNDKICKWVFRLDDSMIKNDRSYKIDYAFSLPNMFPLTNGRRDPKKLPYLPYTFESVSSLDHYTKKMNFILSFDKDIALQSAPSCSFCANRDSVFRDLEIDGEYDNFYKKYNASHKKIENHNSIQFQWNVSE